MARRVAGPNPDEALADLYDLLERGPRAAFGGYGGGVEANLGDFAQEALIKITGSLDSFRGESRFTTWAQKIAMNVALTELKPGRWHDVSLQDLFARRSRWRLRCQVVDNGVAGVAVELQRVFA